jgi:23S rRNA (uracil1939-C5)-methyltransferase
MSRPPAPPTRRKSTSPRPPEVEIEIERLNDAGLGVGRHQGKEIVVGGVLPGERVAVSLEREGRSRSTARLRRVLTPSPQRVPSPCAQARGCEGCPLIAMSYDAQLRFKEERVQTALGVYPSLKDVQLLPSLGADHPLGYRTSARFTFTRQRGQVRIGLYRRGIYDVPPIGDCPIHHPLINRIVATVREEVQRQEIYVYNPLNRRGLLRYLVVKVNPSQEKAMVTFVTAERNFREVTHLAKWLTKKVPQVASVQQSVNPSEGATLFGRETVKVLGLPDLLDQIGDARLRIHPASQVQVNNEQSARIYALVRQWAKLTSKETALELYCGNGALTLHLARDAGKVFGIDPLQDAVREARENARLNTLSNCTFSAGDPAEIVPELALQIPPAGVAVINSPRAGCEEPALQAVADLEPRTVIVISGDPRILARDLDVLYRIGYSTEEVQPFDLHPQTPRIDSVARLVQRRSP